MAAGAAGSSSSWLVSSRLGKTDDRRVEEQMERRDPALRLSRRLDRRNPSGDLRLLTKKSAPSTVEDLRLLPRRRKRPVDGCGGGGWERTCCSRVAMSASASARLLESVHATNGCGVSSVSVVGCLRFMLCVFSEVFEAFDAREVCAFLRCFEASMREKALGGFQPPRQAWARAAVPVRRPFKRFGDHAAVFHVLHRCH